MILMRPVVVVGYQAEVADQEAFLVTAELAEHLAAVTVKTEGAGEAQRVLAMAGMGLAALAALQGLAPSTGVMGLEHTGQHLTSWVRVAVAVAAAAAIQAATAEVEAAADLGCQVAQGASPAAARAAVLRSAAQSAQAVMAS